MQKILTTTTKKTRQANPTYMTGVPQEPPFFQSWGGTQRLGDLLASEFDHNTAKQVRHSGKF